MTVNNRQKGFTIIELMLALAFLTFLLIFVVAATVQLLRIYNKGITIKQINQSSRTILEGVSRDIENSKSVTLVGGVNSRFCTDAASYVWNVGTRDNNKYAGADKNTPLYLVRSSDTTLCTKVGNTYPAVSKVTSAELLNSNVIVNAIAVTKYNQIAKLYNLTIKLGTADEAGYEGENITSGICDSSANGQFCATANFQTIIYARNAQ